MRAGQRVSGHRRDCAALRRLPGCKFILTHAARAYALRVLGALGLSGLFDAVSSIEEMATIRLQRIARRDRHAGTAAPRWSMQPAYVDRRVRRLGSLLAR